MSYHDTDLLRRIELERAEAKREALEEAIDTIRGLEGIYRNDLYRKAWKVAVESINRMILKVGANAKI